MKEQQIVEAARKLFTRYGFKKVSMDEIAREAKVTKRTVYMYFSSKEELLKYFITEELMNMKKIVESVDEKNNTFIENLHEVAYKLLKNRYKKPLLRIIVEESEFFKNEIIIDNLKVLEKKIMEYIKEKIEEAVQNDYIEVKNTEVAAFLVYKMYVALLIEWNDEENKLDEKEIADTLIKVLQTGLLKRKEVKE